MARATTPATATLLDRCSTSGRMGLAALGSGKLAFLRRLRYCIFKSLHREDHLRL
jgi:hypothetical protein